MMDISDDAMVEIFARLDRIDRRLADRELIAEETCVQHERRKIQEILADGQRVLMARSDAEWLVGCAVFHENISVSKAMELLDCNEIAIDIIKTRVAAGQEWETVRFDMRPK